MAVTLKNFFYFGHKYHQLLAALFETGEAADAASLRALIERHIDETAPSMETIEEQLLSYGILEQTPYSDTTFELRAEVRDLLAWIQKRQVLATADVIRGYLNQLRDLTKELQELSDAENYPGVVHPLTDLDRALEKIRAHGLGNYESIATQVQELQSQHGEVPPRERFQMINRIWNRMLRPLRQLIDDRGPIEERFDHLNSLLKELADAPRIPRAIQRRASHSRARLARTRRDLMVSHNNAVREVEPLYEQLRLDSRLLEGASRLLKVVRQQGAAVLELDARMCLEGWRPRGLFSDDYLQSRLTGLSDYEPDDEAVLGDPLPIVTYEPLRRQQILDVLYDACPINDVLQLVLEYWSERPLIDRLKIFASIHRGDFGLCQPLAEAAEQTYPTDLVELRAWPMKLEHVER